MCEDSFQCAWIFILQFCEIFACSRLHPRFSPRSSRMAASSSRFSSSDIVRRCGIKCISNTDCNWKKFLSHILRSASAFVKNLRLASIPTVSAYAYLRPSYLLRYTSIAPVRMHSSVAFTCSRSRSFKRIPETSSSMNLSTTMMICSCAAGISTP